MKVRVLDRVCVGHAMCTLACPEMFLLGDEDGHAYAASEDVPAELEANVEQAQRSCPEGAIEIW